jgi:hopanoid biosynthesis associated RND transporter like protein HpnN
MFLAPLLAALVGHSRRRAPFVLVAAFLLAIGAAWFGATHLAVSTDTDAMFAASLPWRQRQIVWQHAFPQFSDLLVGVVDANTPEAADETAAGLATALARDGTHFREVRRPDAGPYFDRNGFLFLDPKALEELLNRTIDAQPFLGQLAADPTARGLFSALALLAVGVERGQAELASFAKPLEAFHRALADAAAGRDRPLSWERLIAGALADQAGGYRFVLAQVRPDYTALQPGAAATRAMREAIAALPFVRNGSAHVRITGSVALSDEEFGTVAKGMTGGLIGSVVLIALWLLLALHTWRLIVPVLLTLALGLALTLGFAALAVGTLNLVSVAFAILFVGIAVDFTIQFSVRLRRRLAEEVGLEAALHATALLVAPEVLVAALTTACGFLAFVPTSFAGVAGLGLIAGGGMIIAFLCTILFMPAAIGLCRPRAARSPAGLTWGAALEPLLVRVRWPVLIGFGLLALAGAALVPLLRFDSDPLHTKNPNTEAMRTLADLMASPVTNPYTVDILAPSLDGANALAERLRALPPVASVLTLQSFVPADQPEKLALIADAANILAPTLAPPSSVAPITPADLRLAAETAASQLKAALPKLAADDPLRAIAGDLQALSTEPDAALLAANAALTRFLPSQLQRLRTALQAGPVSIADVPPEIRRDWLLPDGRARVQVIGTEQTHDSRGLHVLVDAVRTVAPDAQGTAVIIVETAATIVGAFRDAAVYALGAIAVILIVTLRRAEDVVLVMAPLLLGALLTVLGISLIGQPLNFANIIALPLLLGLGVSFNVYFVMNRRAGAETFLGTPTARAVVFSAFTTGSAFGTLALSPHPGTASMGLLLVLSLGCTLVATLLFLPTLLCTLGPVRAFRDVRAPRGRRG